MIRGSITRDIPHWVGIQHDWRHSREDPCLHLVSLGPAELKTHALVIGSTGSGKTNLMHHLIAQDLMRGHSIAVLDLRGDLVEAVLSMCAGRIEPEQVKLLDLREKERPLGFDPLFGPGEPYFRALGVLDAVESESESWGVQLAESLRNALMLLAEAGKRMTELEHLFHDRAFRLECISCVAPSPLTEFWLRFDELSRDRQQALSMPVLNKVSLLFATQNLRTILGHPTPLDLSAQVNRAGTVTLISLAVDELHAAGRMVGNLVLSALCREALSRVAITEAKRNPIRLYVDEFEHFLVPDFETILAEGRRFGISVVLAHQTLAQLTPKLRSMILNNVGVKFAFRCGRDDAVTLAKDITGDAKSVDLHDLQTGVALLWVRNYGWNLIEVNEPLIRLNGQVDACTKKYLEDIRALNGEPVRQVRQAESGAQSPYGTKSAESNRTSRARSSLEDWLKP